MERILMSKRDSAQAIGVCVRTLENLIARKEISVKRIGRRVLIPRQELERFAREVKL